MKKTELLNTSIGMDISLRMSGVNAGDVDGMDYLGLSRNPKFL